MQRPYLTYRARNIMKSEQSCPLYLCYRSAIEDNVFFIFLSGGIRLKESVYKSYDELPLFLNAEIAGKVLGVSTTTAYELMHEENFPGMRIGSRLIVSKEKFREWVDRQTERNGWCDWSINSIRSVTPSKTIFLCRMKSFALNSLLERLRCMLTWCIVRTGKPFSVIQAIAPLAGR